MKTHPAKKDHPQQPEPEGTAHDPAEPGPAESDTTALADLQADLEKFRDLAQRSAADFDNYRKRSAREREEAVRFANAALLEDLLPVLDNFHLGLEAARQTPGADAILQGLGMVARQFDDFLGRNGVERIPAEGAEFDPNLHEAVGRETGSVPEGQVIRQVRPGYTLRGRLLRPASVVVSGGPA